MNIQDIINKIEMLAKGIIRDKNEMDKVGMQAEDIIWQVKRMRMVLDKEVRKLNEL